MDKITKREKMIVALIMLIVLVFFMSKKKSKENINLSDSNNINQEVNIKNNEILEVENDNFNEEIYVHICGRVKNPGLIKLSSDSRVIDAVEASGGVFEDADLDKINLAKKLKDEERVYIPKIEEQTSSVDIGDGNLEGGQININTAEKSELETLPGIGPKMAEKIIEHRQNEEFSSIEDIKSVSGIGDKKFEEIKKLICIN